MCNYDDYEIRLGDSASPLSPRLFGSADKAHALADMIATVAEQYTALLRLRVVNNKEPCDRFAYNSVNSDFTVKCKRLRTLGHNKEGKEM